MATEDEIKRAAYKLWEEEGQPVGKDMEHYFRAARILEKREATNPSLLVSDPPPVAEISSAAPTPLLKPRNKTWSKKIKQK